MAQGDGDSIVSKDRIPPVSSELKTLDRQEKFHVEQSIPNFSGAYRNLAFTPSAIGQLGSQVSLQASLERSRLKGEALGKNPHGDLLPPITKTDKALIDSYSSQAQATLGLQAQSLINKNQEQLDNSYNLTQSMIATYQNNTAQGLQEILNNAPSTIKGRMENQFSQEMISKSHSLNEKLISQNLSVAKEKDAIYNSHQIQQIHNAELSGNSELALSIYDDINKTTKANLSSGIISPIQAESRNVEAKTTYYASQQIKKALDARNNGKLEGFLSSMIDSKPDNLSWSEWETVRNQTISYVGQVENLDNRDQSLIISQATATAQLRPLSSNEINDLQNQLTPTRFNNFMVSYRSRMGASQKQNQSIDLGAANWTSPTVLSSMTPKQLDNAFMQVSEAAIQKAKVQGKDLSLRQAKLETAITAGMPIPSYIKEFNASLTSGNPQLMLQAAQDLDVLRTQRGGNARGISKDANAMNHMFTDFVHQGVDPQIAAQRSYDVVFNKTPEVNENNTQLYKEWMHRYTSSPTQRDSWARTIAGISSGTLIQNQESFSLEIQRMMKENMQLTNGNVAASESMLQTALQQNYGLTSVNGEQKFDYLPIEKVIEIEDGATPLIQEDIYHQVSMQIMPTEKAYKEGRLDYYYRMKPRMSLDEYLADKAELEEKTKFTNKLKNIANINFSQDVSDLKQRLSDYEKGQPIEIEMVHRNNEVETYKVNTHSGPFVSSSNGEGNIIGGYDISLSNDKGGNFPITGAFSGQQNNITYRPDKKWIREQYFSINGIDPSLGSNEETFRRVMALRKQKDMEKLNVLKHPLR